jgi:hypothetical protein
MIRPASILLGILAFAGSVPAQDVIIRRAMPAAPLELRGGNLTFVLPNASISKSLNGAWISRNSAQDAVLTFRPIPDAGVLIRYTMGVQVGDGWSNGRAQGWAQAVGLRQRPALVAELSEKSSLELAMESRARFDQAMRSETAQRAELALQTGDVPGLMVSTKVGREEINDAANVRRTRNDLALFAEQKVPWLPVRLNVAPSVAQETTPGVPGSDVLLTGVGAGLLVDVAERTTLSLRTTQNDASAPVGGVATSYRAYATQIEQRFLPAAVMRLQTSYEEQWSAAARTTAAIFLGAESTFTLTESITGGLQLRQRAMQFLDTAGALPLPETVLSFSLGGSF